jgi:hypothetical protein
MTPTWWNGSGGWRAASCGGVPRRRAWRKETTALHFESNDADQGVRDDDLVAGSQAAGAKTYKAPRKRGWSKNGRSDVPQIVVELAASAGGASHVDGGVYKGDMNRPSKPFCLDPFWKTEAFPIHLLYVLT